MSSCFLLKMKNDSIEGIYDTLKQCALISKCAGGIGVAVSNIRAKGGYIRGTNGHSNGLVPMLRNFNETARYVDQGGGRRKGSFAMYLEPWHADIFDFIELRKNLYVRRTLSGEFVQVNRHLLRDLIKRSLWTEDLRMQLIAQNGSVQNLDLPADLRELYKTVWEVKQRIVLDMAADRGAYIDQSQSLNIHMVDATTAK